MQPQGRQNAQQLAQPLALPWRYYAATIPLPWRYYMSRAVLVTLQYMSLELLPDQPVTNATNRENVFGLTWVLFKLFAQISDVHVYCSAFAKEIGAPHLSK
jgi:hypothetical protein